MKPSAIFYVNQFGCNQYDTSTIINMRRTSVQGAFDRIASTDITLTGKEASRLSIFEQYTKCPLERVITRDAFQTMDMIRGELRLMDKDVCRSIVKKQIKQLGFRYYSTASKPKGAEKQKKSVMHRPNIMFTGSVINGNKQSGLSNQDSACLAMMVSQRS